MIDITVLQKKKKHHKTADVKIHVRKTFVHLVYQHYLRMRNLFPHQQEQCIMLSVDIVKNAPL